MSDTAAAANPVEGCRPFVLYIRGVDLIEFKLWKALALVVIAFFWGMFCSATNRDLTGRRREPPEQASQEVPGRDTPDVGRQ